MAVAPQHIPPQFMQRAAELKPVLFEGFMAGGVAAGGQLTTTTDVENFPGFPEGVMGPDLCDKFRAQSLRFGTVIHTETVNEVDLSKHPFTFKTDAQQGTAQTIVVATGATAKRLEIEGAGDGELWQKGILRVRGLRWRASSVS